MLYWEHIVYLYSIQGTAEEQPTWLINKPHLYSGIIAMVGDLTASATVWGTDQDSTVCIA